MLKVRIPGGNATNSITRWSKWTTALKNVEKKVEGTFAEKWLKFWMNLGRDYRDVAIDVAKEVRTKPTKAILIATSGWLATIFARHNPNAMQFRDAFVQAANEAILVNPALVKPDVLQHLKHVEHWYNNSQVRHTSFGLFSLVWIDKYSQQCTSYESRCDYLRLRYAEKLDRVIDIGFLDTWWCLAYKMRDYDVNF